MASWGSLAYGTACASQPFAQAKASWDLYRFSHPECCQRLPVMMFWRSGDEHSWRCLFTSPAAWGSNCILTACDPGFSCEFLVVLVPCVQRQSLLWYNILLLLMISRLYLYASVLGFCILFYWSNCLPSLIPHWFYCQRLEIKSWIAIMSNFQLCSFPSVLSC